jgi:hypothetical protein
MLIQVRQDVWMGVGIMFEKGRPTDRPSGGGNAKAGRKKGTFA